MYQYMRIQGRDNSYVTGYPKGIFSLCWNLVNAKVMTAEEEALFISLNEWFKAELPEPEPCKRYEPVITFFKCGSTELMRQKLEPAIGLLEKYRVPYDVVYTNFVGTVIYEDAWQVAVPVKDGKMV